VSASPAHVLVRDPISLWSSVFAIPQMFAVRNCAILHPIEGQQDHSIVGADYSNPVQVLGSE